jgi:hypothetical protein
MLNQVRITLGLVNTLSLAHFRASVKLVFGTRASVFFSLLALSQFHFIFWCSRTLPNMFAFPIGELLCLYATTSFLKHSRSLHRTQFLGALRSIAFGLKVDENPSLVPFRICGRRVSLGIDYFRRSCRSILLVWEAYDCWWDGEARNDYWNASTRSLIINVSWYVCVLK